MLATDTNRPLMVSDRCDRCGAQAKVRATLANGELYFCGHHVRKAKETLKLQSVQIYDPESVLTNGR